MDIHLTRARTLVQTCEQPSAILDIRFHVSRDRCSVLAVASSTGTLSIFQLDPATDEAFPLRHLQTSRCDDLGEDIMFLQCQWQPDTQENNVGVTTTTGQCRLLVLNDDWAIKTYVDFDISNTLEAWSLAFAPDMLTSAEGDAQQVIYCGGDDSVLRYISCKVEPKNGWSEAMESHPMIQMRGQHNAGVTAILPLSLETSSGGRLVVTGSYDDTIRLFSIQDPHKVFGAKSIQLLADCNLGGGVWRLNLIDVVKSNEDVRIRVLASCMYAGARIILLQSFQKQEEWKIQVLAQFEEHESMNYGSDFIVSSGKELSTVKVVSTSFYDKLLCLWEYSEDS